MTYADYAQFRHVRVDQNVDLSFLNRDGKALEPDPISYLSIHE